MCALVRAPHPLPPSTREARWESTRAWKLLKSGEWHKPQQPASASSLQPGLERPGATRACYANRARLSGLSRPDLHFHHCDHEPLHWAVSAAHSSATHTPRSGTFDSHRPSAACTLVYRAPSRMATSRACHGNLQLWSRHRVRASRRRWAFLARLAPGPQHAQQRSGHGRL